MPPSKNKQQKERVFLLFAYPMGHAKGGVADLQGHFADGELARKAILSCRWARGRGMDALKASRICGHVAVFEKGALSIIDSFDPDQGWGVERAIRQQAAATSVPSLSDLLGRDHGGRRMPNR